MVIDLPRNPVIERGIRWAKTPYLLSGPKKRMNDETEQQDDEGEGGGFLSRRRHRWWDLRASFLTGLVVAAPLGITAYLAVALINFADDIVRTIVPDQYNPETYLRFSIPGLGLIIVVVAITLLGALTANLFGHAVVGYMGRLIDRLPVVRTVYGALRQMFETVVSQSERSFQQVGLIQYPRPGLWAIVFVAARTRGEIIYHTQEEMVSVFLPTTPNPTSGFLLFVPRKDIIILDMTVEEGAKLVISGGLVIPDFKGGLKNPCQALSVPKEPPEPQMAPSVDEADTKKPDTAA